MIKYIRYLTDVLNDYLNYGIDWERPLSVYDSFNSFDGPLLQ